MNPSDFQDLLETISLVLEDVGDGKDSLRPIPQEIREYVKAIDAGKEELDKKRLQKFAGRIQQVANESGDLSLKVKKELENNIIKELIKPDITTDKLFDISNNLNTIVHRIFQFKKNEKTPHEKELHGKLLDDFLKTL